MSPGREIRPTANGTDRGLAADSTTASVPANDGKPAESVALVGASVEKGLAAALARFVAGEIQLSSCTPSLQAWYLEGHRAALASSLPELTRAEQERDEAVSARDVYYRAAFDPRQPITIGPTRDDLEKIRAEMYSGGAN